MTQLAATGRVFTTGNRMCAQAALDAGCRFFAGYPITPASEIYRQLTQALPAVGGVAMAAPDEISAIAYCIGASMRGIPSMTATSGPGWCLMVESVGYALMTETPVVIALVQRLGPSTGAATQSGQGDIALVQGAVSGGYQLPVFAPSTAEESYADTLRAFAWAERLRTPVVVLTDKEVASTSEVVDTAGLPAPENAVRTPFSGDGAFLTYGYDDPTQPPPFVPVGGAWPVKATGSAHDKAGRLRKNDPETLKMLDHLHVKIQAAEAEIGLVDVTGAEDPDTLVIAYGVSARASRDAVAAAVADGRKVALATVRTLFPVPKTALRAALRGVKRVIVPEENHTGLYRAVIGPILEDLEVVGLNRVGSLITPAEVRDAIG